MHTVFLDYFNSSEEASMFFMEALPDIISTTARELQGMFYPEELEAVVKAMHEVELVPHAAGKIVYQECTDLVKFDLCGLGRKIHIETFLRKIKNLTVFQSMFLELWAKRYWEMAASGSELTIDYYASTLQKIDKAFLH